jgi:tetratricopeptide (TPR) repeat protein
VLGDPQRRAAYECTLLVNALREQAQPEPAPEPPPAQDPLAEQQRADELLAAAEALFAGGTYWDALRQCEDLLPLARGKTRRRARVLLAECYLKNPNWRKQGEEELQAAIQEDPDNADACFLLGRIYKQGGLRTRALAMFRRVLELRPRHAAAAEELASLQGEGAPGEGGFLRKFRS